MTERATTTSALQRYAMAARAKVLTSQSDLDPTDRPMPEMYEWCEAHPEILVLQSAVILSSDPSSRNVQNCKTVMLNKGLRPGRVLAATDSLITMLKANIKAAEEDEGKKSAIQEEVSNQQQRLRILVEEAMSVGVSDIHIEVRTDMARIRFRKNGELYLHAEWFPRIAREIASVAFNKETDHATEHFNPNIPQNASMPLTIQGKDIRLRLASMPAHGGFDMVMRLLGLGEDRVPTLEELGYTSDQVAIIRRAVGMPHGAILLSGPTGSGKTTTLATCLNLVKPTQKAYTIEDPVEKVIKTATQVPVNTDKDDRSFASFGKACLRMDPDFIVLGEMRDEDTANVMVRASITGHLVFSTIHTNTAPTIITRLEDLGVSPVLLGDTNLLVCLICQRLAPVLCQYCKIPIVQSAAHQEHYERFKQFFADDIDHVFARGSDCPHCHGSGVSGRTVVAEVIWVDDKGREFIQALDTFGWEKYLKSQGWKTYKDHALRLVREGRLDPFDAEKIMGEINSSFATGTFNYNNVS